MNTLLLSFMGARSVRGIRVGVMALSALTAFVPRLAYGQSSPCVSPGGELVAWWPAERHVYNVVNQRAGSVQGSVAYSEGVVGQGFSFDGTGKVRVLEAASIDLSRTNRWTVAAWVRPTSFSGSVSRVLYTEGNRVAALTVQAGSGKLESWINGGNRLESDGALPLNGWSHVALVLDRTTRTLYVNGLPAGTGSGTPGTTADSTGAAIGGATADDPAVAFVGDVDEVTLHKRALSAQEVAAIHAAGAAGWCVGGDGGPVFLIEPVSQTAALYGDVTFSALAHGSPPPTYQWLLDDAPLAGETNLSLVLASVTSAQNGHYRVTATSGGRTVSSAAATLAVEHCVATPTNLVAWWPGDGSALEVTGQHPGVIWNQVDFPAGIAGRAFGFDGVSSFVAIPDHPALSPQAGPEGQLTVEVWVRLAAFPAADPATSQDRRVVLAKGDPGRWEYGLSVGTTGVPEFFVWTPDGTDHASVIAGQLLLNQWHHLVATYQRGQSLKLYQDGQLMAGTASFTGTPGDTGSPLYLGRRGDAQFLAGWIDEPAVYSRALGPEEVAALHAGGSIGKCYGGGPKPVVVQEPRDVTAYLLNSATLEGLALGTPRPVLQWYFGDQPIPDATHATLTLRNLTAAQAGAYMLVASNLFGATQSRVATLTLVPFASTTESFELGWNGWSTDDYAIWQVGQPTSGSGAAHSGSGCAATVLNGDYPEGYEARLVSPYLRVPSADESPRLRFWHWWNFNCYDYGQVQIREGSGPWIALSDGYSSTSLDRWSRASLDLRAYAGKTVQLGFFFHSHSGWDCDSSWNYEVAPGWYIDDVTVETGPLPELPALEDFEAGWGGWMVEFSGGTATEFGLWEIGSPTSGPGTAFSGTKCAATILSGDYPEWYESRMVSPAFVVPSLEQSPRLRFWHWWNLNCYDYGQVQVREGNGPWMALSDGYSSTSLDRWSRASLDLRAYAGKTVQLGFFFHSHSGWDCDSSWNYEVAPGWYIDDVTVETGPLPELPVVEGFESGWGGWKVEFSGGTATEFGLWEIGTPTSGPGIAFSGTQCAATILSGDYPEWYESRMVSPGFVVPSLEQSPRLRFWHWWNLNCYDYGQVQIREGNGPWMALSDGYSSTSLDRWSRASLDLGAYAGKTVQLGFFFHSHSGWDCDSSWSYEVAPGWYIDDVMIQVGSIGLGEVAEQTVDEKTLVSVRVNAVGADANSFLSFTLPSAPAGAWIDPETGVFSWVPSERQGPATHRIPVLVVDYGHGEANEMTALTVNVREVNEPSWLLPASVSVRPGELLRLPLFTGDRDDPPNALEYTMAGAPMGAALDGATGLLHWAVPLSAASATYGIQVTLNDHGTPPFTTNTTVTVTVSPQGPPRLGIRPAGAHAFEFTIEDGEAGADYVLQSASPWVDQASWALQASAVPGAYPLVEEQDYGEHLSWEEFVAARLQRTEWTDVVRVSPAGLPHVFIHPAPDAGAAPVRFFRVVRVPR